MVPNDGGHYGFDFPPTSEATFTGRRWLEQSILVVYEPLAFFLCLREMVLEQKSPEKRELRSF